MMSNMTHTVHLTPRQRFVLSQFLASTAIAKDAKDGKALRRFIRDLYMAEIQDVGEEHGRVNASMAKSRIPSLFYITDEELDYGLRLSEKERPALIEVALGDFFDQLEDLKAGREVTHPAGAVPFASGSEDWAPRP